MMVETAHFGSPMHPWHALAVQFRRDYLRVQPVHELIKHPADDGRLPSVDDEICSGILKL